MELYPLSFSPKLLPKIWGGRRLERYGKALPQGEAIGESWELYDRPDASAVVDSGPLQGQTLHQIMQEFGPRLLGQTEFEKGHSYFPLMVKMIDAQEALSVQVHPDDAQALRMVGPQELGKTEMWVIVEAEPGSKIVAGLKAGSTRQEFSKALQSGQLDAFLQEAEVRPWDRVFLPAGRLHAIGKGCLVAELQQNSDTTWRVYDYGRLENGKPRALHISQALECLRFDPEMDALPALAAPGPLNCQYFKSEILEPGAKRALKAGAFQILLGLEGQAKLSGAFGKINLNAGSTLLIPASVELHLEAGGRLLWAMP